MKSGREKHSRWKSCWNYYLHNCRESGQEARMKKAKMRGESYEKSENNGFKDNIR